MELAEQGVAFVCAVGFETPGIGADFGFGLDGGHVRHVLVIDGSAGVAIGGGGPLAFDLFAAQKAAHDLVDGAVGAVLDAEVEGGAPGAAFAATLFFIAGHRHG
jgi:hypothetical protein